MNNNFNVAWCPFCNQGWVQIVKDSANSNLILLCAECDTTWINPEDVALDKLSQYEFTGKAISPGISEVEEIGWDKNLLNE